MASKSKKRRRVLGASCILAALIIAGSSFAWFTSKDEVTNRLTANADYGVSIVESFAPPENWLPGQQVNKDVYAVNTGNVDAFVEETVSGRLTITKEEATEELTADSITLTKAERYVVEAGAFLAYKPENSNAELGKKVVSMVPDSTDLNGYEALNEPLTDFTPDAPGLYVFRRTIGVDPETRVEKYTYDGYYYVKGLDDVSKVQVKEASDAAEHPGQYKWESEENPGNFRWTDDQTAPEGYKPVYVDDTVTEHDAIPGGFYKISNLKVTYPGLTLAGDADPTDGILATAEAGFCEDKTYVVDPVDLKYDEENNRLVASYYTGKELDFSDSETGLPALAKAYDDALVAYEDALEEYRAAIRDQAGTNAALAEEYNDLQDALDALQAAINAETKAYDDLQKAIKKEENTNNALIEAQSNKDAADAAVTAAQQAYDDADLANQAALADVGDNSSGKTKAYNEAQAAVEAQQALLEAEADSARDAFVQYLVGLDEITCVGTEPTDEEIKTYFNNVTYEHLHDDLAIVNDGGVEYRYYEKLVELKRLEKERDAKKTELEAAQAAQRVTAQNLATAQAALDAATEAQTAAGSDLTDATNAHNTAVNELGTSDAANDGTDTTAWGRYNTAVKNREDAEDDVETARSEYDAAATAAGTNSDQVDEAKTNLLTATQNLANAQMAYENAAPNFDENDGVLKININLSDKVTTAPTSNDQWQLMPDYIGADKTAYFYYTGILGAGETSSKLIDSVELDSSVTEDMFKYFDFDLNVGLKSAQIAMDSDGKTILTTAADNTLDANATLATPTNVDTKVTWAGEAPAAATSYTAKAKAWNVADEAYSGDETDVTITKLATPVTVGGESCMYVINGNYYGSGLTSGKVFTKATQDSETGTYTPSSTEKMKLTANATPVATP